MNARIVLFEDHLLGDMGPITHHAARLRRDLRVLHPVRDRCLGGGRA